MDMKKQLALTTLTALWAERQELAEREVQAVERARLAGASWADIGDGLGVSRQAAHERFSRALATPC